MMREITDWGRSNVWSDAKNFSKLSKEIKLDIQEALQTPNMINIKKTTPDIIKPKHKEKVLKSS